MAATGLRREPPPAKLDALDTSLLVLSTDLETRAESSEQEYGSLQRTIDDYSGASRSEREASTREIRRSRIVCWFLGVVAGISSGTATRVVVANR